MIMRFLKSLILSQVLFASLCFFINTAQAQDVPKGMFDRLKDIQISPEKVVSDMKDKLGLTDDQTAKVLPIIEAQVAVAKEVINGMSSGSAVASDTLTKMQDSANKTNEDLAQILTPEQMTKWHELMHQGQEKANQMMEQSNSSSAPVKN
jgi:Spy/CpxP family protein refolding chaperone